MDPSSTPDLSGIMAALSGLVVAVAVVGGAWAIAKGRGSSASSAKAHAEGVNVNVGSTHPEPTASQRLCAAEVERRLAHQATILDRIAATSEKLAEVSVRQQALMERLGFPREQTIFVGDSPDDRKAAEAAGVRFVPAQSFFAKAVEDDGRNLR